MSTPAPEAARARILIVEDSSVFREMQSLLLGQAGYAVSAHEKPHDALAAAGKHHFDLVVIDYELPDMNGQQFMHELRKLQPEIAVVFVSGSLTLELAIQLSSQGVAGIFNKPANPKTLLEKINETLARSAVRDTAARTGSNSPLGSRPAAALPEPTPDELAFSPRHFLGASDRFREFTHRLWKVRDFRAVLLLQGETGSAFEPIARDLAEISVFREGPVMVCRAAEFEPRRLIEVLAPSLLSHDAGTLILTGVEQFTAAQQTILDNLMTGRDVFLPFARRFRLLLAATPALSDRVDDGTFDETLYYKIGSLTLTVPALRDLREDIVLNARHILAQLPGNGPGRPAATLAPDAEAWLEARPWSGSYAELVRIVGAAGERFRGEMLTAAHLEGTGLGGEAGAVEDDAGLTRAPFGNGLTTAVPARAAPARPPASAVLTAKSLFRPASRGYSFTQRLTEALGAAKA